eukprot:2492822-Heterocapsa_arctica.AAC.1
MGAAAAAASSSAETCSRTNTRACRSSSKPRSARTTPRLGPECRAGPLVAAADAAPNSWAASCPRIGAADKAASGADGAASLVGP